MSARWGKLAWALVAVGIIVAGAWIYARLSLADRVSDFHTELGQLGYSRGGRLPTEEQVRGYVTESAAQTGLEVSALEVSVRRERGLDGVGQMLQDRVERVPGAEEAPRLSMELAHYDIHASVRGDKWLWSTEAVVDRTVTLRGPVSLDGS